MTRRRAELASFEKLRPPDVVVGDFEPSMALPPLGAVTGEKLRGLAVSPGIVEGRARVILGSDARERLLPGEILVATFTDPGWTPYFVAASAVVVDIGGLLSHAAWSRASTAFPRW